MSFQSYSVQTKPLTFDEAYDIIGGLSDPSKMPGKSWDTSARKCYTGGKLRPIKGSVCNKCYAFRGNFNWPATVRMQEKRYESISNPRWVEAFVKVLSFEDYPFFRWFSAGDVQSVAHLAKIAEVARRCPNIQFWLPTKEIGFVTEYFKNGPDIPPNLIIRLSGFMIDQPGPVALARKLGLTISEVTTDESVATCPSYKQDGKCGACRLCWDKNNFKTVYLKH